MENTDARRSHDSTGMVEQGGVLRVSCESFLWRAELCAELLFKHRNNFATVIADLRIGQRRFSALESHADQQRIFSGRDIFPAEKIRRFDVGKLRNVERADRI